MKENDVQDSCDLSRRVFLIKSTKKHKSMNGIQLS